VDAEDEAPLAVAAAEDDAWRLLDAAALLLVLADRVDAPFDVELPLSRLESAGAAATTPSLRSMEVSVSLFLPLEVPPAKACG
jgi:hypothetical protein